MSTLPIAARRSAVLPIPRAITAAQVAGLSFFGAGVIVLLGIITAEALYPIAYTTFGNEISDLGGTRPPASLVFQPSATIFNTTMLLAGLLVSLGVVAGHRVHRRWAVTLPTAALGISLMLLAVFPGNTGNPHAITAMVAFFSGGFAAVFSSLVVRSPFRYALMALGVVTLACLASYFALGDANPMWALGVGGAERWVAYPEVLWMLGFGGYLAGSAETSPQSGT
jgi:hypothetical membrane protein